jgi:molecular chaperone GrpE (heat shock protein)
MGEKGGEPYCNVALCLRLYHLQKSRSFRIGSKPIDPIIEQQRQLIEELKADREMQARIIAGLQSKNEEQSKQYQRLQSDYVNLNTIIQRSNPTFSSNVTAEQFQQLVHRQKLDNLKIQQGQLEWHNRNTQSSI